MKIFVIFIFMLCFGQLTFGQDVYNSSDFSKNSQTFEFVRYARYNIKNRDSAFVSKIINKYSANELKSYNNTPKSVVEYFIASQIRSDTLGKSVLNITSKDNLKKLARLNSCKIINAIVLESKEAYGGCFVKVFLTIAIFENDKIVDIIDDTDDFNCRKIEGLWKIIEVPN